MQDLPALRPVVRIVVAILCAAACGLSLMLLADHFRGTGLPGCGSDAPCGSVMATRWAWLWKFPVSGFGAVLYAAMLALTLLAGREAPAPRRRTARSMLIALAVIAVAAGLWFTGLQQFIIHKFCSYCLIIHACGLIASGLIFNEFRRSTREPANVLMPVLGGTFAALLFVGSQALIQPRMYRIVEARDLSDAAGDEKPLAISATQPAPQAVADPSPATAAITPAVSAASPAPTAEKKFVPGPRRLSLLAGKMSMNVEGHPILGSPEAPHVIVELFDYTCPECRFMHGVLAQALERYPGQLAILVLPVPLNQDCNPAIRVFKLEHADSCTYARLCLAVWQGAPERFAQFDKWMWEGATAPPITAVRSRAEELVGGSEALEKILADPAINAELAQNVKVFEFTIGMAREGTLPKLLMSSALISGRLDPPTQLFSLLEQRLKLVPRPAAQP